MHVDLLQGALYAAPAAAFALTHAGEIGAVLSRLAARRTAALVFRALLVAGWTTRGQLRGAARATVAGPLPEADRL